MSERSTFSPFWHRVRALTPRLRSHVQVRRQVSRGRRWHVVSDPSSNAYYRLTPVMHEFVGLLDGRRTVEEVWRLGLERHADEALTQNDVIQILGQLYSANLLQADIPPESEQLLSRGRERLKKKALQQAVGLMYFRVPLFNPDRLLTALEPIFRPALSMAGFLAWLFVVIAALAALTPHWEALAGGIGSALAPANWGYLLASYVVLKLWHELGHGLVCKRFGGQVPVLGAMMLVLVPSPYVDASSSWGFKNKWQRIAVGGAGMMFELLVAAGAAFVWIATLDTPGLANQLAYNVMLTSGVATVLFNANPLMKFDGYYMLSDLIEVPNLMPRSMNMLKFLFQKHMYRVENPQAPTTSPSEALILLVFGVASLAYRVIIFLSITLYVMGLMFGLGVFLAVWTAAMWFILPIGQWVRWLASSPQLTHFRARAVAVSVVAVVAGLLLIGAVPRPDHRRVSGVVESTASAGVFAGADGFIKELKVRGGERVRAGDLIVTLENPQLDASLELARAQLEMSRARLQRALMGEPALAGAAEKDVVSAEAALAFLEAQRERLVVRSPSDGVVVLPGTLERVGAFVQRGEQLCEVIDDASLRVAAVLPQDQADWIASLPPEEYAGEVRRVSRVERAVSVVPVRTPPAARRELPHAAMGFEGGGQFETRPTQDGRQAPTRPVFNAYFAAAGVPEGEPAPVLGMPGERVHLRFTLPSRPLLAQWVDRIRKAIQGRAQV